MENVKQVTKVLTDAKAEILELLPDENDMIRLGLVSGLDRLINRMLFFTGDTLVGETKASFPPITEFMGEPIHKMEQVAEADLDPEHEAKDKFLKKVDDLEINFPGLDSKKILESYKTKEDVMAIRGVAKRAGIEDFKTAKITVEFLEQIRQGLIDVAADKAFIEKENDDLNK